MTGVRRALIVATDEYSDPKLTELNAPAADALALADVLQDANVGAFEVQTVLNQECQDVRVALARFLKAGRRDDTLLLHFSCHGVKDLGGELYFATKDTDLQLLEDTGVSSARVKAAIDASRAGLILCLVDCCYAGAFGKGVKAADTIDLTERLGGHGRAVITASNSLQLALDGEETPSLFTKAVVEGLRTGDADIDLDGLVSLDEFYSFVHDRVTAENPLQTPVRSFEVEGDVYVARRGSPVTSPAPLPQKLLDRLKFGEDFERRGVVTKLAEYLVKGHPGRAVAARMTLEQIRDTDVNLLVRQDAAEALAEAGAESYKIPEIPPYDPGPGPGPGPRPDDPEPDNWKKILAASAALLVLIGAVVVIWYAVAGGDDDDGDGDVDVATLGDNELLVPTAGNGQQQIMVLDVETGDTRVLLDGEPVYGPTITQDRQRVAYLVGKKPGTRVAYLAAADGTPGQPLLNDEQRAACPYSTRPAQSSDGGSVALICLDDSGQTSGLYIGFQDQPLRQQYASTQLSGAPTWTGNGDVIFAMPADRDSGPDGLWQVRAGSDDEPERITTDDGTWATHPDWSDAGLLYVRASSENGGGDVFLLDGSGEHQMTSVGDATAPAWSPGDDQFAYVAPGSAGGTSVWVQDAEAGATPQEFPMEGAVGPPAWGPR